jgi:hypothetical protein
VKNGFHLWSERYDREMKDVFEIQDEISAAIASTVKGKLIRRWRKKPQVKPGTDNLDAYHLYLRGRYPLVSARSGQGDQALRAGGVIRSEVRSCLLRAGGHVLRVSR